MAFAALIQGALNERESKIDEQKDRMKRNEDFMMQSLREAAPRLAAERAKGEEYNNRYSQAFSMTGDDWYSHQYAIDQKLGTDWLFGVRKGQPGQADLSGQTSQAMGQTDPASQGHANFNATSGQTPPAGTQQADQTGTALSKVGSMPQLNGQGAPGAAPQAQPNSLPNNPMAGITANAYDPNARMHFRDILFGQIPPDVQAHDVLNHVATYTGHTPQEVQQNYNSYMSGDYIFRPSFAHAGAAAAAGTAVSNAGPGYIPPMDQKDVMREVQEFGKQSFKTADDREKAMGIVYDALLARDPGKMKDAYRYVMSTPDVMALQHPSRIAGAKSITENQFDNDIKATVGQYWGAKASQGVQLNSDGSQFNVTTFDYGNNSAMGAGSEYLAREMVVAQHGQDSFLKSDPSERAKAGAVATAYMAAEGMAQIRDTSNGQYQQFQSIYNNARKFGHVTDQDMINAASVRDNQVVFKPEEANVVKMLGEATASGNAELLRSLKKQYPDITAKFMKDTDNKGGLPGGSAAAPAPSTNKYQNSAIPGQPDTVDQLEDSISSAFPKDKGTPNRLGVRK